MATRQSTTREIKTHKDDAHIFEWTGLLNGDDGTPIGMQGSPDRSLQVTGAFGTGGAVTLEGSNDEGATWAILNDPQGVAISIGDANTIVAVQEMAELVRPRVTAGDGGTNLTAHLFVRRPFR